MAKRVFCACLNQTVSCFAVARRASGGAPFSAGRGPRASTAKSRASTTGDLLLPVAEEEEEEHYQV